MKQLQLNVNDNNNQIEVSELSNHENSDEYEVEALLDDKIIRGRRKFLAKWKNCWVEETNLNCRQLLSKYSKSKTLKK